MMVGDGGADDGGRLEMVKPTCPQELLPCHRFPPSAQMLLYLIVPYSAQMLYLRLESNYNTLPRCPTSE